MDKIITLTAFLIMTLSIKIAHSSAPSHHFEYGLQFHNSRFVAPEEVKSLKFISPNKHVKIFYHNGKSSYFDQEIKIYFNFGLLEEIETIDREILSRTGGGGAGG